MSDRFYFHIDLGNSRPGGTPYHRSEKGRGAKSVSQEERPVSGFCEGRTWNDE